MSGGTVPYFIAKYARGIEYYDLPKVNQPTSLVAYLPGESFGSGWILPSLTFIVEID